MQLGLTRLRLALLLSFAAWGCSGPGDRPPPVAPAPASLAIDAGAPPPPDPPAFRHQPDLPPERRAMMVVRGERRVVDAEAAVAAGFTLVDLRDEWTPFLFELFPGPEGRVLENRYRSTYLCLANDRCDEDGEPLPAGEVNYLELFGIPPTPSVLRKRFLDDEARECLKTLDYDALAAVDRIPIRNAALQKKYDRRLDAAEKALEAAMNEHGVDQLAELLPLLPEKAGDIEEVELRRKHRAAYAQVEARLRCEGWLTPKLKHEDGVHDEGLKTALRRFQRRHMVYAEPFLTPDTMRAMKKRPVEGNHDALVRMLRERVVDAAHVLEDGSVEDEGGAAPVYRGADGEPRPVRNLVAEFSEAALVQLDLDTPEKALAFFSESKPEDFQWLRGAVRLPRLPEYYAPHMDLFLEIDRGDVWYDPPWHPKTGELRYQGRQKMPTATLFVTYREQRFPLVRWKTTIGGWRAEQAGNGYEYWRYKESDVGARVIRKVAAGPTWIPPETTPLRGLVKGKTVNGAWTTIVNYDEMGPGYLSAYGLVAGYFVVPREGGKDWDNGIRMHGSSDYISIGHQARYSHGCHRLMNHLAVRFYGFVLNHRTMKVNGDQALNMGRQFLWKDEVYEIRQPTRGFEFELTPPMPVEVLRGRVRGTRQKAPGGYYPKPELKYPPGSVPVPGQDSAATRAGGAGAEPAEAAE